MHVGRLLAARTGGAAVRDFKSSARAVNRRQHWAAAATSTSTPAATGEDEEQQPQQQQQQQDTLRATLRDLPGPVASVLADELLLCGALSASVDEYRAPGGAEQELFGARGRDGSGGGGGGAEEGEGGSFPSPSDADGSAALLWDRCTLTAIFGEDADVPAALREASLAASVDPSSLPAAELSQARASEWLDALRGAFSPVFVEGKGRGREGGGGRGLWILPEGCSLPRREEGCSPTRQEGEGEEGGRASSPSSAAASSSPPPSPPPPPPPVVVRLTPGLAFGTGDHPTTRMCLRWLATADVTRALRARGGGGGGRGGGRGGGASLLDFGTGSGVLAAAAIALGCPSAVGTDVDPLALTAAAENAALNVPPTAAAAPPPLRTALVSPDPPPPGGEGLRSSSGDRLEDPVGPPGSFDVVVANILRGPLVRLAPSLGRWAAPGAPVAVSGVLASQAADVARAFAAAGVELAEFDRERCGGGGGGSEGEAGEEGWWVCLSGRKSL